MTDVAAILLGAAARGAVVLLVALVLTSLLQRRPAAVRHAVWAGAIAVQLFLPVLALWGPRWRVPVPETLRALVPEVSIVTAADQSRDAFSNVTRAGRDAVIPATTRTDVRTTASAAATTAPAAATPAASAPVATAAATSPATPMPSLRTVLVTIWALGAAIVLLRLAMGTMIVARLARRGARIDDGSWLSLAQRLAGALHIQRPLILLRGDRLGVPVTWGIVYPIVLLPEDADEWSDERRRYVLVHEMAHVKRLDALTQLLGQVALAFFWFDPLVWIANRRLQLEREHACDDYVLRQGTLPSTYAADLLEMVQSLGTPAHRGAQPAFAALAMARRSEFEGRMLSILDPVLDRHPLNRGRTLMSAFATLLLVVPLAALQPIRSAPQSPVVTTHSDTGSTSRSTSQTQSRSQSLSVTVADSNWSAPREGPVADRLHSLDTARATLGRKLDAIEASHRATGSSISEIISSDQITCDQLQSNGSTFSMRDVDRQAERAFRLADASHDHCIQTSMRGEFTTSPAEDRIATLSPDGLLFFRERAPGTDRAVIIRRAAAGRADALDIQFHLNGADVPFDAAAQRWLAGLLPEILAEWSINVEPRVARWRAEGGTDAVLRHIAALKVSGAKANHYDALLKQRLPPAELQQVVVQAGKDVPSSSDLRDVLSKAAAQSRTGISGAALESSIAAVASSDDRTAVLKAFGQTDDRDQLLSIMNVGMTIPSSSDKANFMRTLAPRYLGRNDAALRDAFFRTLITIPSSSDRKSVLDDAIPFAVKSTDIALAVIAADSTVPSSSDRADVLIALADRGAIRTPALHDAYLRAVQGIPSSTDMRNALEALTKH
jgi:beta-lactamase regulating signal transducer with metallopeptidase domain